jgi:hypothetical protein
MSSESLNAILVPSGDQSGDVPSPRNCVNPVPSGFIVQIPKGSKKTQHRGWRLKAIFWPSGDQAAAVKSEL